MSSQKSMYPEMIPYVFGHLLKPSGYRVGQNLQYGKRDILQACLSRPLIRFTILGAGSLQTTSSLMNVIFWIRHQKQIFWTITRKMKTILQQGGFYSILLSKFQAKCVLFSDSVGSVCHLNSFHPFLFMNVEIVQQNVIFNQIRTDTFCFSKLKIESDCAEIRHKM